MWKGKVSVMNKTIYMDNAATTRVLPEVFEEMKPYFLEQYGNPSSVYSFVNDAKKVVDQARVTISDFINAKLQEIYFYCQVEVNLTTGH